MAENNIDSMKKLSIAEFFREAPKLLDLKVLAGASGMEFQYISSDRIQKLGLGFAGYSNYLHHGRIQMIGQSEIQYLNRLSKEERKAAFSYLSPELTSCFLVAKGLSPPDEIVDFAELNSIPVLGTPTVSSKAISLITGFLQEKLAPEITLHGVLIEMQGVGVLIIGESGIGKSECALELISKGHRLVSDDVVRIKKIGNRLEGTSPEITFEYLEIRGLGIVNVRELFGGASVCQSIGISLCIEFKRWEDVKTIERIGLEMLAEDIFGVPVPKFLLPVRPGRNLATLVETAVRVFILRNAGHASIEKLIGEHSTLVNNLHNDDAE